MLKLQNGKFDSPNRMFHSINDVWNGIMTNQADVKELVPEFYQPESRGQFLSNTKRLNLGVRHDSVRLDDVVLPPWASSSSDFIQKLRDALESDYVSNSINNWIDLVFGYKQTGVEAIKSDNLFYPLTYEGAVDIDAVSDPMEKASVIAQIKEFGQTPKQLFSKPHPQRLPASSPQLSFSNTTTPTLNNNNNQTFMKSSSVDLDNRNGNIAFQTNSLSQSQPVQTGGGGANSRSSSTSSIFSTTSVTSLLNFPPNNDSRTFSTDDVLSYGSGFPNRTESKGTISNEPFLDDNTVNEMKLEKLDLNIPVLAVSNNSNYWNLNNLALDSSIKLHKE